MCIISVGGLSAVVGYSDPGFAAAVDSTVAGSLVFEGSLLVKKYLDFKIS